MDDQLKPPTEAERLAARTSERVGEMSDEARAELHRKIHEGKPSPTVTPLRKKAVTLPYGPVGHPADEDPEAAAAVVRIQAELHATERRLNRLERGMTRSRYQMPSDSPPHGRYARLLRRAERLERQLRRLR
jgi:hypothetical protein